MAEFSQLNEALVELQESLEGVGNAAQMLGQNRQATLDTIESVKVLTGRMEAFLGRSEELSDKVVDLTARVDTIDFPERFDSLNSNISEVNATVNDLLSRQKEFERRTVKQFNDRFQDLKKAIVALEETAAQMTEAVAESKRDTISSINSSALTLQSNLEKTIADNMNRMQFELSKNRVLSVLTLLLVLTILGIQIFLR